MLTGELDFKKGVFETLFVISPIITRFLLTPMALLHYRRVLNPFISKLLGFRIITLKTHLPLGQVLAELAVELQKWNKEVRENPCEGKESYGDDWRASKKLLRHLFKLDAKLKRELDEVLDQIETFWRATHVKALKGDVSNDPEMARKLRHKYCKGRCDIDMFKGKKIMLQCLVWDLRKLPLDPIPTQDQL
ncbi:hypothetical protein Cgig2_021800 [Carnegiea gigantea]|uniref:Uncharacterized protein n=1 Tax=Carnegiea gigantea TaxID=171969 RepID=A0A9Q1KAM6_9CARY|nr:hypothetical protein Cgig2_021800 [Carnegiea gigantea]